jgi:hypothetical protein
MTQNMERSDVSRINTRSVDSFESDSEEEEDDNMVLLEEHYDDNCRIPGFDNDGIIDGCLEGIADKESLSNDESQALIFDNLSKLIFRYDSVMPNSGVLDSHIGHFTGETGLNDLFECFVEITGSSKRLYAKQSHQVVLQLKCFYSITRKR